MIAAAILLCDRKREFQTTALSRVLEMGLVDQVYVNIQTEFSNPRFVYHDLYALLEHGGKPYEVDLWSMQSTWWQNPQYDQHQTRLVPITMGRNMAIDYALHAGVSHILYVDSDVRPHLGGLQYLVNLNVDLCGGYVPGRGVHSQIYYVFPGKVGIRESGDVIQCAHGTCGYMLVSRTVFGQLRFRWGDDWEVPGQLLSEDPAYCNDWRRISGQPFLIDKRATADHLDSPTTPLTHEGVAQDNWNQV